MKAILVIPPVLIFGILIILLSIAQQSTTFAQTTEEIAPKDKTTEEKAPKDKTTKEKAPKDKTTDPETKSVNDVSLRAVFYFNAGVEEITTFKAFKLLTEFDKPDLARFELTGIIDGTKPMLHAATHEVFHNIEHETQYSDFKIELYLTDKDLLNTRLQFEDCSIIDFTLETLYDKNKTWQGVADFAWLEFFEFECLGAHPFHLEEVITDKVSEKKESLTWKDLDLYP